MSKIFLIKNEERRLKKGHLWVFSNEIEKTEDTWEGGLGAIFPAWPGTDANPCSRERIIAFRVDARA